MRGRVTSKRKAARRGVFKRAIPKMQSGNIGRPDNAELPRLRTWLCLELGNPLQEANNAGPTALHGAAHRGSNEIVQFLVAKGAKLDAKDAEGRTPLIWAEGVAIIDQRLPRPQPHTVALLQQLMK